MSNLHVEDAALTSDVIIVNVEGSICPMLMSCCYVILGVVRECGVCDDNYDDDDDVSSAAGTARCAPACCRCSRIIVAVSRC